MQIFSPCRKKAPLVPGEPPCSCGESPFYDMCVAGQRWTSSQDEKGLPKELPKILQRAVNSRKAGWTQRQFYRLLSVRRRAGAESSGGAGLG